MSKFKELQKAAAPRSGLIGPCIAREARHAVVHYVGFRDDRFWNAYRIWGGPRIIHRWWDKRAKREVGPDDIVIFAEGDWRQEPRAFNAPDITEPEIVADAPRRALEIPDARAGRLPARRRPAAISRSRTRTISADLAPAVAF